MKKSQLASLLRVEGFTTFLVVSKISESEED